jgi:hypothetical protein
MKETSKEGTSVGVCTIHGDKVAIMSFDETERISRVVLDYTEADNLMVVLCKELARIRETRNKKKHNSIGDSDGCAYGYGGD